MNINNTILNIIYTNQISRVECDCLLTSEDGKISLIGKAILKRLDFVFDNSSIEIYTDMKDCIFPINKNKTVYISSDYIPPTFKCVLNNFPKNEYMNENLIDKDITIKFPLVKICSDYTFEMGCDLLKFKNVIEVLYSISDEEKFTISILED